MQHVDEAVRKRKRSGPEDRLIDHAEDGRGGADAHIQRQQYERRITGPHHQPSRSDLNVVEHAALLENAG